LINQSDNNKQNFNDMYNKDRSNIEQSSKLSKLEEEKANLIKKIEEKDELISFVKQENETLNEQYYSLDSKIKESHMAKQNLQRIVNLDIKNMFDSVQSSLDNKLVDKSQKELKYIYRYLTECVQNLQEFQDPNEINLESQNNSNYQNIYFEDENSRIDKQGPKSSYITQNYEKFKLQQEKPIIKNQNSQNSSTNNTPLITNTTNKSALYQNLVNKTPIKDDIEKPSVSMKINTANMKLNQPQLSENQNQSKLQQFNPNPLTSHLKTGSFNTNENKFVTKFLNTKNN